VIGAPVEVVDGTVDVVGASVVEVVVVGFSVVVSGSEVVGFSVVGSGGSVVFAVVGIAVVVLGLEV